MKYIVIAVAVAIAMLRFNSSVVDSEPWAYLFLYKLFPTPFTGSRQRVYPSGRLTTRKLSDDLAITMFENSDEQFNPTKNEEPLTAG